MERYGGGSIVVSEYNPAWPATFEQERTSLHTALGPLVLTIEHIGSTAVPGLAAKPIIDLQLSVRSLAEARSSCVEPLQVLGNGSQVGRRGRSTGLHADRPTLQVVHATDFVLCEEFVAADMHAC